MLDLRNQVAEGCGGFSTRDQRDDANAIATMRAAYESGIRIFDTARAYATVDDPVHNETLVSTALRGRDDVVIMTKGGHFRTGQTAWDIDNTPARLRLDVEDSLRALGRERLDLYYLHRADGPVDIDEAFGTLGALQDEGKLGAIGISNATSEQIEAAMAVRQLDAVQNRLVAGEATDALRCAEQHGLAFFAYSPLGGPAHAKQLAERFPKLALVAQDRRMSVQRLALRGMLAHSPALSVIVGVGSPERARESAQAARESWDDECENAWLKDVAQQPTR